MNVADNANDGSGSVDTNEVTNRILAGKVFAGGGFSEDHDWRRILSIRRFEEASSPKRNLQRLVVIRRDGIRSNHLAGRHIDVLGWNGERRRAVPALQRNRSTDHRGMDDAGNASDAIE